MKKAILILFISLIGIVGYGQIVQVHTTLLKIDGVEHGQLLKDKVLPIAWEYNFIITDTLDWTTIPIDSLAIKNNELQMQVDSLEIKLNDLIKLLKTQPVLCE